MENENSYASEHRVPATVHRSGDQCHGCDMMKVVGAWAFGIPFVLAFTWLQFGGIWHSFMGHGSAEGLCSVFLPPVSWYYAVEFFLH